MSTAEKPLPCPFCRTIPDCYDEETVGVVECSATDCPVKPSVECDHMPAEDGFAACNGSDLATEYWNERAHIEISDDNLLHVIRKAWDFSSSQNAALLIAARAAIKAVLGHEARPQEKQP